MQVQEHLLTKFLKSENSRFLGYFFVYHYYSFIIEI